MKHFITTLFCIICFTAVNPINSIAQTDTTRQVIVDSTGISSQQAIDPYDDEFNIFLFVIAIGFVGAILGAAVIGAFAAALFLFMVVFFVVLGVVSTSFIVGLYKKSFESGFNTFILTSSIVIGIVIGSIGFWLIDKIFRLEISASTALITGSIGGVIGGLIISFTVLRLIRFFSSYVMKNNK